jgi:hypothetical protein
MRNENRVGNENFEGKKRVAMNEKKKNSVIKLREFKTPDKLTKCFFKN